MGAHIDTVLQSEDRAVIFYQERNTGLCEPIWILKTAQFSLGCVTLVQRPRDSESVYIWLGTRRGVHVTSMSL